MTPVDHRGEGQGEQEGVGGRATVATEGGGFEGNRLGYLYLA